MSNFPSDAYQKIGILTPHPRIMGNSPSLVPHNVKNVADEGALNLQSRLQDGKRDHVDKIQTAHNPKTGRDTKMCWYHYTSILDPSQLRGIHRIGA